MLNEYEKGVTLRALKKLLNEYKRKLRFANENELSDIGFLENVCVHIQNTIGLVEVEEIRQETSDRNI